LTVRTDRADYALDNLNGKILPWNKTEYRYLKRQSARHSGRWETIDDPRFNIVGAIRK
jgi:predicted transglutaminase-like cysteine proteinase